MGNSGARRAWYGVSQDVDIAPATTRADEFAGRLTELAADRIRMTLPRWIEPGTAVNVGWNQTRLFGMIETCHPRRDGYGVEMRLDDVTFVSDLKAAAWRTLFDPQPATV
jgi:hypothetical protein